MPLPNTRMIHPQWQARNARVALGGMQTRIRLSRPQRLGVRDPVSGKTALQPEWIYYEGPARLQSRGAAAPGGAETGAMVTRGNYLLVVPLDIGDGVPRLDDVADVLSSPDPLHLGLRLYVVDVPTATQILQRNLGADLYQPTERG